jgi:hypothetical protein
VFFVERGTSLSDEFGVVRESTTMEFKDSQRGEFRIPEFQTSPRGPAEALAVRHLQSLLNGAFEEKLSLQTNEK